MPARSADTPKTEIYYSRLRELAERAQPERWSNYEPIYAFFEANRDPADKPGELIYDPDRDLIPNLDHILDENLERYPVDLRDNSHRRRMMQQSAVTEAGKRAQMNDKVAVPQFYFGTRARSRVGSSCCCLSASRVQPAPTSPSW